MNTQSIEMMSKYVNRLKTWEGFQRCGGKLQADELPTSLIYDSAKLSDEVLKEINDAAKKVLQKHIPLAEQMLLDVVEDKKAAHAV